MSTAAATATHEHVCGRGMDYAMDTIERERAASYKSRSSGGGDELRMYPLSHERSVPTS